MLPAARYAALLPQHVRERLLFDAPAGVDRAGAPGLLVRRRFRPRLPHHRRRAGADRPIRRLESRSRTGFLARRRLGRRARSGQRADRVRYRSARLGAARARAESGVRERDPARLYAGAGRGVLHPHAGASAGAAGAARFRPAARRPARGAAGGEARRVRGAARPDDRSQGARGLARRGGVPARAKGRAAGAAERGARTGGGALPGDRDRARLQEQQAPLHPARPAAARCACCSRARTRSMRCSSA